AVRFGAYKKMEWVFTPPTPLFPVKPHSTLLPAFRSRYDDIELCFHGRRQQRCTRILRGRCSESRPPSALPHSRSLPPAKTYRSKNQSRIHLLRSRRSSNTEEQTR